MGKIQQMMRVSGIAFSLLSGVALAAPTDVIQRDVAKEITEAKPHAQTEEISIDALFEQAEPIREALLSLDSHGLSSNDYLFAYNEALAAQNETKMRDWLTDLAADLRFGVARQPALNDVESPALKQAIARLAACEDWEKCMQHIAGRHPAYAPLQAMLESYQDIEKEGGWGSVDSGGKLEKGMKHARVKQLRARLEATGDYALSEQPKGSVEAELFDAALEAAVKGFQARHGLEADGVVGGKTLSALNAPVSARMEQIMLSLERLRQLDREESGHQVEVNIPSYKLVGYEGEKRLLEMPVVVGQVSRKTPLFDNSITTVVLNPTWTPTAKILREDILPKARNNPSYLASGNFVITDRYSGQRLSAYEVDWHSVSASDVHIMQSAGSQNALGKVKFLLPENDSVYLHDTSHPELFVKSYRALSSGCIRLSNPKAFYDYVMQAQPKEQLANADSQYQSRTSRTLNLEKPIRVQTTYLTAWVNDKGALEFYDDVYSKDARLAQVMGLGRTQMAMQ